jgi:hypothetical protein
MTNEGSYVALGLKVWKAQLDRADKLFGGLSSEEVLREIAGLSPQTFCIFSRELSFSPVRIVSQRRPPVCSGRC